MPSQRRIPRTLIRLALLFVALLLATSLLLYLHTAADRHFYANENRALASHPVSVVFMGDSITYRWNQPSSIHLFLAHPTFINRGIDGDQAFFMLFRFPHDVFALHPQTVVFLGGINDLKSAAIPNRLRFLMPYEVEASVRTAALLARTHHERLILCSLTPVDPTRAPQVLRFRSGHLRPGQILAVNRWLQSFAAAHHLTYVDYYSALTDGHDRLPPSLTDDGLHPNPRGYALMEPLIQQAIDHPPQ